ncbi:hypothetical protein NL676_037751 [Syzygium grande]|nr:hypothetical protein NL676_037751 [Syzygium grande]
MKHEDWVEIKKVRYGTYEWRYFGVVASCREWQSIHAARAHWPGRWRKALACTCSSAAAPTGLPPFRAHLRFLSLIPDADPPPPDHALPPRPPPWRWRREAAAAAAAAAMKALEAPVALRAQDRLAFRWYEPVSRALSSSVLSLRSPLVPSLFAFALSTNLSPAKWGWGAP